MQGNTVFYLAASQTALGGHKTYFYVYHNMPIEASTNSFKTPIFKGYSGCVLFGIIVASRAKVAPFAHCLLGGSAPKPFYIRDEATVSDVLEEMYHAEQDRQNKYGTVLTEEVLLRREIDAQKYLISVTEKYKIPAEEVEVTKANLAMYEEKLEALLARGEQE